MEVKQHAGNVRKVKESQGSQPYYWRKTPANNKTMAGQPRGLPQEQQQERLTLEAAELKRRADEAMRLKLSWRRLFFKVFKHIWR